MKIDTELTIVGAEALEKAIAAELASQEQDGDIEELLAKLDERADIKDN